MSVEFPEFPISLSISADKIIELASPLDIRNWCEKEIAAWRRISGSAFMQYGEIFNTIEAPIQRLNQAVNTYESSPVIQSYSDDLRNSIQYLSAQFRAGQQIYSESPLGQYILEIAESEKAIAAATYFIAIKPENENFNPTKSLGIALGYLANYYSGVSKRSATSAIKSIEKSAGNYSQLIATAQNESDSVINQLSRKLEKADKKIKAVSGLLASQIRRKRVEFDQKTGQLFIDAESGLQASISSSETDIKAFKDFMEKQISLQVPASYWASKRNRHRNATVVSGFFFLLYIVVVATYTWCNVTEKYLNIFGFLDHWKDAGIGAVGVMAGILALVLIFARVLYRNYASQLHLWNDAGERVTMIETYLALAEKGHAKEEFLGALMSRLFMPASDGIVRDDLGSIGPLDLASKLTSNR